MSPTTRIRPTTRFARHAHGVFDTLTHVSGVGVTVVAFTKSNAYWTEWPISKTDLDGPISVLYSAPDQRLPRGRVPR